MTMEGGAEAVQIGILGMEIYFPSYYVDQSELECHDGVSKGKYTIGLGQNQMAICSPFEDAISLCLTAFSRLISRFSISPVDIGRIDVGSESNPDRAKAIKSHLFGLLNGSASIAGSDCVQACYGGTGALLNSLAWLESSQWEEGKVAIVVAGDVAIYPPGPARATGGAGAVAILLGRASSSQAPLAIEPIFGHCSNHVYDFYKPNPFSEYPLVDGPLSIAAYLSSVNQAFINYLKRRAAQGLSLEEADSLEMFDRMIFHSPYSKIVFKSFCQLDHSSKPSCFAKTSANIPHNELNDEELQEIKERFAEIVEPTLTLSRSLGNSYCASVFCNLLSALQSMLHEEEAYLPSSRIGFFSYGSGSMSSFFVIKVNSGHYPWLLDVTTDMSLALADRIKLSPQQMEQRALQREAMFGRKSWEIGSEAADLEELKNLRPGAFYLREIDAEYRRHYCQKN